MFSVGGADGGGAAALGLTTKEALAKLVSALESELAAWRRRLDASLDWRTLVVSNLEHANRRAFYCWTFVALQTAIAFAFLISASVSGEESARGPLAICGLGLAAMAIVNVLLSVRLQKQHKTELYRKAVSIVRRLGALTEVGEWRTTWNEQFFADPHAPTSECITVQWTYRDGQLVNLPWMLLVDGDVIELRPGREAPCKCALLERDDQGGMPEYERGQLYRPRELDRVDAEHVKPLRSVPARVLETPAISYFRHCALAAPRPVSVLQNELYEALHVYVERFVFPTTIVAMLLIGTLRFVYRSHMAGSWEEMFLLLPAAALLPTSLVSFPLYLTLVEAFSLRRLVRVFDAGKSGVETASTAAAADEQVRPLLPEDSDEALSAAASGAAADALFSDAESARVTSAGVGRRRALLRCISPSIERTFRTLRDALCCVELVDHLPLSANFMLGLGNVTALAFVDKKGILSWPNPTPEKLSFFHYPYDAADDANVHRPATTTTSAEQQMRPNTSVSTSRSGRSTASFDNSEDVVGGSDYVPTGLAAVFAPGVRGKNDPIFEVMDFTVSSGKALQLRFDDTRWARHMASLKPIGLNILLNSCREFKRDYMNFLDHIHAVSVTVPRTIAVASRRCVCALPEVLGFRPEARALFENAQTCCAYRRTPGEAPLPGLVKHRSPLPNAFSVFVEDKTMGLMHCMSQGTADILLDVCDYFWDGRNVRRIAKAQRKKMLDFYHRYSMTAYCLAFAFCPAKRLDGATFKPAKAEPSAPAAHDSTYIELADDTDGACGGKAKRSNSGKSKTLTPEFLEPLRMREIGLSLDSLLADDFVDASATESTPADCLRPSHRGQVFLGTLTLQYQARPDVVHLVEQLEKSCIRFIHFSRENELRSRVFAEKMGLEAGWNCWVELSRTSEPSSEDVRQHESTAGDVKQTARRRLEARTARGTRQRRMSLPSMLKFDLPTVQFKRQSPSKFSPPVRRSSVHARGGAPLADTASVDSAINEDDDSSSGSSDEDDAAELVTLPKRALADGGEASGANAETASHFSVVTSNSSMTAFSQTSTRFFVPPYRSGLPKGIEHVRQHLETVDNVPLLVNLFSDSTPSAVSEMVHIAQDYGEIVCVVGSSLNYYNAETFVRADCAISIEPLPPLVCCVQTAADGTMRKSVSTARCSAARVSADEQERPLTPTQLVNMLSSLPCSLHIGSGEHLSLLQLIAEARHCLFVLRVSLRFLLQAYLALAALQALALLLFLPPAISPPLCAWLTCVVLPALAASLCASPLDSAATLKTTTAKNAQWIRRVDLAAFATSVAVKFAPSAIVCVLLFRLSLHNFCQSTEAATVNTTSCGIFDVGFGGDDRTWNGWRTETGLVVSQNFCAFSFLVYVCVVSATYVNVHRSMWKAPPFSNLAWTITVVVLIAMQAIYAIVDVRRAKTRGDVGAIAFYTYILAALWPFAQLLAAELLKRREIVFYRRDQRRRRLNFGTKLGMNSPF